MGTELLTEKMQLKSKLRQIFSSGLKPLFFLILVLFFYYFPILYFLFIYFVVLLIFFIFSYPRSRPLMGGSTILIYVVYICLSHLTDNIVVFVIVLFLLQLKEELNLCVVTMAKNTTVFAVYFYGGLMTTR